MKLSIESFTSTRLDRLDKMAKLPWLPIHNKIMTIEPNQIEIDLQVPDGKRCGQCNNMAVMPLTIRYLGKTRILDYLCQGCLDTMKRDALQQHYQNNLNK